MRFSSVLVLGAATALMGALPLIAQTPAPQSNMRKAQEAPHFENLQVLPKDIPPQQLFGTMRGFTKALGVECEFCHAENPTTHHLDFASDAKPDKGTARTMIRMVEEINTKYLATIQDPDATAADKTVTCGTCHRGHPMPEPFVAPSNGEHHMPAKKG